MRWVTGDWVFIFCVLLNKYFRNAHTRTHTHTGALKTQLPKKSIREMPTSGFTISLLLLARTLSVSVPSSSCHGRKFIMFLHCPSLSIPSKFSTPTLWSAPLDGLLFLQLSPLLSAGVPRCAPIPFSQVIAQGILIKVKICCWEVTFQTSCDFNVK